MVQMLKMDSMVVTKYHIAQRLFLVIFITPLRIPAGRS
jgi:hypothetical protein